MGLITTPLRGLFLVFEEIAARAEKEINDDEAVKAELTALYSMLEAGTITEEEFERREMVLANRLEEIEQRRAAAAGHARASAGGVRRLRATGRQSSAVH